MSRFPSQSTAGLLVLVAGMVVVYTVTTPAAVAPPAEPVAILHSDTPTLEPSDLILAGVSLDVQRVLFANGNAEKVEADELTEVPPEVARVLIHYGATLTIATGLGAEE